MEALACTATSVVARSPRTEAGHILAGSPPRAARRSMSVQALRPRPRFAHRPPRPSFTYGSVRNRWDGHARHAMMVVCGSVAVDSSRRDLLGPSLRPQTRDTLPPVPPLRRAEHGRQTEPSALRVHSLRPHWLTSAPIMLTSAHIRNYRILRDLEIPELQRINVFTGGNDSGKTSLLEALFLLSRGANPNDLMDARIVRGKSLDSSPKNAIQDTLWKPIFSGLDNSKEIAISGQDTVHGLMQLTLHFDRSNITISPSIIHRVKENMNYENSYEIALKLQTESGIENQSLIHAMDESIRGEKIRFDGLPYSSTFVPANRPYEPSVAEQFGSLEMKKQDGPVISALKMINPNLRSIRNSSATGQAMLWADIGLESFLPLAMLGNGMVWVAEMMVSAITVCDGILLIDGFENGIHHSLLPKVWRAIYNAAVSANVQILATTHSHECIDAIHESLDLDTYRVHRLESTDICNRCVTYGPEAITGAMEHQFEVR